jgi:acetyltransferase-like isoleucine patch superfamily enzyme
MSRSKKLTMAYEQPGLAGRVVSSYIRTRLFTTGGKFGIYPQISGKVRFRLRGSATFGDRFNAEGLSGTVFIMVEPGATLVVGDDVYLNGGVCIEVWHEVRIGNNVLMAPFVSIIDDDRHELEPGAVLCKGPTVIGNNVWLGRNVAVLPGVTIGDGSAVGANSVVTKDIPPNSFAAGSPARIIRKLEIPEGWSRS